MELCSISVAISILWKCWLEQEAATRCKFDTFVDSSSFFVHAFVLTQEIPLPRYASAGLTLWQTSNADDTSDFRAKLEQRGIHPQQSKCIDTSKLYRTSFIEKGTLILSQSTPKFGAGLLRHPFWHKAVILILEHENDNVQEERVKH
jgi:hypothetical protein